MPRLSPRLAHTLTALCLGSLVLSGCSDHPAPVRGPALPRVPLVPAEPATPEEPNTPEAPSGIYVLEADDLDESSGLVASRKHPGVFWSQNDSGGDPELFAIDGTGAHRGRVRVGQAIAKDWEDLAMAPDGSIWIHDGGNNANRRRDLRVYRAPEPDTLDGVVQADRAVLFRFPDQEAFPDAARVNFDSEALFWDHDRLLLLSKHRSDTKTTLYRFPAGFEEDPSWDAAAMLAPGKKPAAVVLERLGSFDVGGDPERYGGKVTAADLSPDGARLAVLTYHALFVFERPTGTPDWLQGAVRRIDFDQFVTAQCEAIAWDGDALLFTNEQRLVLRIANPLDPSCVRFPSSECRAR